MSGIQDIYELSPMQHGMLFDSVTDGDSGMYLIQLEYRLEGDLRVPDLERAWQQAVERHAILRTSFHWDDLRKPQQVVHASAPIELPVHDWSGSSAEEVDRRFTELREEDRRKGVDFERPPLTRLALIRTGPASWRLLWTVHHILVEGWSASLILQDVLELYRALRADAAGPASLPVRRPYRDYIAWIQQQDPSLAESHWRAELAGFRAVTPLGIDRATPGAPGAVTEFDERELTLPADASGALRSFAQGQRLTLNTVVQGAWAALLSRYADAEDVVFGTIVSGRSVPVEGIESMVGLFINLMPARVRVPSGARLAPWLRDLQARQAKQRAHEHVPLVEIKRWSEVGAGMPLFESLLVFENWAGDLTASEWDRDLRVVDVRGYHGSPGHPLMAVVVPGPELSVRVTYDRNRFDADAIDRLLANLGALLRAMTADPERPLAELPLPSPEESARLDGFNRSASSDPAAGLVHEQVRARAAERPDGAAIVCGGRTLTYAELAARADGLAAALRRRGVGRGSLVAVCVERGPDMVAALLAILEIGAAYVPLDPAYPPARLRFILEHSRPAAVVTETALAPGLSGHGDADVVLLDGPADAGSDDGRPASAADVTGDDPAYVIYTSGSTGVPKGVSVPHRALTNFLESMRGTPELTRDDTLVAVTTLSFDISGLELWLPLTTGARLVLADRMTAADGEALGELLRTSRATVMQATPATWRLLVDSGWSGDPALKALCGGEALPPELAAALGSRCRELWNLYGPTETTIWSTVRQVEPGAPVTVGGPIAGTQVHVLDRRLRRVPIGIAGEVFIAGDGVAHGYLRRAELTAERFLPDPFAARPGSRMYRTGDVGRRLPDGDLQILGRTDHQVKIRGFRIELGEIEATLERHPGVREAVALAREDAPGDRRLVAYVVAAGETPAVADLRRHAGESLPDYMVPSAWVMLDALPRTPNGKVDRRALPAPDGSRPDLEAGFIAPRTPVEQEIAEIWQSVLEIDRVGVRDNFFDLGGHSLLLMPVIDRLKKRLGVKLRPGELILPTLGQLAALCEERRRESGGGESRNGGGLIRQLFQAIRSTVSPGDPPR